MAHKVLKSAIGDTAGFAVKVNAHAEELRAWHAHMERVREEEKSPLPPRPQWDTASNETLEAFSARITAWDAEALTRHQPYPEPKAHPDVDRAVRRDEDGAHVPDFEVVDDSPRPEQILAAKKQRLFAQATEAEQAAIAKIMPPAKRRHFQHRLDDIRAADKKRVEPHDAKMAALREQLTTLDAERGGVIIAFEKARSAKEPDATHIGELGEQLGGMDARRTAIVREHNDIAAMTLDQETAIHAPARSPEDRDFIAYHVDAAQRIAAIGRIAAKVHHDIEDLTTETVDGWTMPSLEEKTP